MQTSFFGILYIATIGYFVVFLVLFMLFIIVTLMRKFDDVWLNKEDAKKAKLVDKAQDIDNTTIILISAAVGTFMKGASIKRIRVLPSANIRNSSWSVQGRESIHGSHFKR